MSEFGEREAPGLVGLNQPGGLFTCASSSMPFDAVAALSRPGRQRRSRVGRGRQLSRSRGRDPASAAPAKQRRQDPHPHLLLLLTLEPQRDDNLGRCAWANRCWRSSRRRGSPAAAGPSRRSRRPRLRRRSTSFSPARPASRPSARWTRTRRRQSIQHNQADVEFMQGMIHHHQQAIDDGRLGARPHPEHEHPAARAPHGGLPAGRDGPDAEVARGARRRPRRPLAQAHGDAGDAQLTPARAAQGRRRGASSTRCSCAT